MVLFSNQRICLILAASLALLLMAGVPVAAQDNSVDGSGATQWPDVPTGPPVRRPDVSKPVVLRIGTWNLDGSVPASLMRKFVRAKNVWRTTFGPRKSASDGPDGEPPKIEADIMALQSVTDIRILRRLFPARDYYIVVSRQLLNLRQRSEAAGAPLAAKPQNGTTAVVIKRGTGIRLIRQEQIMRFAGTIGQTPDLPPRSAAVAVRLLHQGRRMWVMSVNLNWDCSGKDMQVGKDVSAISGKAPAATACKALPQEVREQQLRLLRSWLKAKRGKGDAVIVAGSFGHDLASGSIGEGATNQGVTRGMMAYSAHSMMKSRGRAGTQVVTGKPKHEKLCTSLAAALRDGLLVDENSTVSGGGSPLPLPRMSPTGLTTAIIGAKHCPLLLDLTL